MQDAALTIAQLMCASARTAPKSRGMDTIVVGILSGDDMDSVANEMDVIAKERNMGFFARDAKNIRASACAVLVGVNNGPLGLECGACATGCSGLEAARSDGGDYPGPMCIFKGIDLGIALSSAAKTASMHNADNRIMYTAGLAATRLGVMDADIVVAIPISLDGKNIFFDR